MMSSARTVAHTRSLALLLAAAGGAMLSSPALAQLRIATWNVSGYNGSNREQAFKTAIYGAYQGRQMAPDVLIVQEIRTEAGLNAFRNLLNSAPGSPGDWQASLFVPSPDGLAQAFFWRAAKAEYLGMTVVALGSSQAQPRPVQRFDIRPAGYTGEGAALACYGTHMKAGSGSGDRARRLIEAEIIRADAEMLHPEWSFLLAGDFNMQSSNETAFVHLTSPLSNPAGQMFDPIRTPGSWHDEHAFRFVHTQAPANSGMDDRFDFILLSGSLLDGSGFDYVGSLTMPYSTSTWNDLNHSYRVWGNDGTTFNAPIAIAGNQMVGPVIAQALHDAAVTDQAGGHLPVFLDLRVPAKIETVLEVDFGEVPVGAVAAADLTVDHGGDVALWTAGGLAPLRYTLEASGGFDAPGGMFIAMAGLAGNIHEITMDTSTPGPQVGTITIHSDAPDEPARVVMVMGVVVEACYANCDGSTTAPVLNVDDFTCFINAFAEGQGLPAEQQVGHRANCDGSTVAPVLNVDDFSCFINAFAQGCP